MSVSLPASMPLHFDATTVDLSLASGAFLLVGWALAETTNAAAAKCYISDGTVALSANKQIPLTLAINESTRDFVTNLGIILERGVFLDMVSGSIEGTIYVVPTEHFRTEAGLLIVGNSRPGYAEPLSLLQ